MTEVSSDFVRKPQPFCPGHSARPYMKYNLITTDFVFFRRAWGGGGGSGGEGGFATWNILKVFTE